VPVEADDVPPLDDKPGEPKPGEGADVARSAAMVNAGIILARAVGLLRQRVQAYFFGTSIIADVLTAAFRVGNITQNLLGEGTLSASFIPVYAKLRASGKTREATHFALACLGLLLAVVTGASALGALGAPWLTWVIVPGFDADKLGNTVRVVRIVFPMTGVLVLSAWALGVLNSHRRFFLPYAAPVIWSLAQIAGLFLFGEVFGYHGEALALALGWSAFVGAGLQLAVLLPAARSLLGALMPRFDHRDPNVREAARRLPGVLLGRGVIQISGLLDLLLVSFLGAGAQSAFGYAQSIYLLPMSLLGTGEAAASLPEMAGDTVEADLERRNAMLRARLGASLGRLVVVTIPASALLLAMPAEIIRAVFENGKFDAAATARVEPLLFAYAFALLANASGRVLTTTFYALGDTRTPARYALLRVVASTGLSLALMRPLDVLGVVLGAVVAAWVETIALALKLRGQLGGLGLTGLPLARSILLAVLAVGPSFALRHLGPAWLVGSRIAAGALVALFGIVFSVAAPLLGLFDVRALLRRRR
jgi:putative peptidoglycan lipid II flippase